MPEEYLTVEIYRGSAFVIAYANVERVRKERNLDYGKTPPLLDISGELFSEQDDAASEEAAPELTQETEDGSAVTDRKGRPFLWQGLLVGPSINGGRADFTGDDWDATLDAYDVDRRYGAIGEIGSVAGYLVPFPSVGVGGAFWGGDGVVWNFLMSIQVSMRGAGTVYGDEGMSYEIGFGALSLPVEAVIGYGGSRLLGNVGAGGGVTLLISEPDTEWWPNGPPVKN